MFALSASGALNTRVCILSPLLAQVGEDKTYGDRKVISNVENEEALKDVEAKELKGEEELKLEFEMTEKLQLTEEDKLQLT